MNGRKIKKEIIYYFGIGLGIILLLVIVSFILKINAPKSIHEGAKSYRKGSCLVFYPNSDRSKKYAKELCNKEKNVKQNFDYSLVPYGDYYLVNYGADYQYFVDKEFKEIKINEFNQKTRQIIKDYLLYTIKINQNDKYYDSQFLKKFSETELDYENIKYEFKNDHVSFNIPNYEFEVNVPIKYLQNEINMNFGYKNVKYIKPTYLDTNHPVIALTFDDGPNFNMSPNESSSNAIVDLLYKYNVNATFFTLGKCLESRTGFKDNEVIDYLNKVVSYGNELGSHTYSHIYLTGLDTSEKIVNEIKTSNEIVNNLIGYQMKHYRPTYGVFSDEVLAVQPYPAILWNVDSNDWSLETSNEISKRILEDYELDEGDVLLFHDVYEISYEALTTIIPTLIDRGFQIVSVEQLLDYYQINLKNNQFFFDTTYYE